MTDLSTSQKAGEDFVEHYGKMGMHWGHRNAGSTSASKNSSRKPASGTKSDSPRRLHNAKTKVKTKLANLTPAQKTSAVIVIISTGATVAAGLLVGPVGSMVVSTISRAGHEVFKTTSANAQVVIGKGR